LFFVSFSLFFKFLLKILLKNCLTSVFYNIYLFFFFAFIYYLHIKARFFTLFNFFGACMSNLSVLIALPVVIKSNSVIPGRSGTTAEGKAYTIPDRQALRVYLREDDAYSEFADLIETDLPQDSKGTPLPYSAGNYFIHPESLILKHTKYGYSLEFARQLILVPAESAEFVADKLSKHPKD
jgi:hypothetical protein